MRILTLPGAPAGPLGGRPGARPRPAWRTAVLDRELRW